MALVDVLLDQREYRRVFFRVHGVFPHPCYFCGETVEPWQGEVCPEAPLVHHVDGDKTNSDPANLVPAHWGCHNRYHKTGRVVSAETRAKIAEALRGRPAVSPPPSFAGRTHTPETRAKMRANATGKHPSPETRARIAATLTGRTLPPEHVAAIRRGQATKPRASCLACRREMGTNNIAVHLASHARGGGRADAARRG